MCRCNMVRVYFGEFHIVPVIAVRCFTFNFVTVYMTTWSCYLLLYSWKSLGILTYDIGMYELRIIVSVNLTPVQVRLA